MARSFSSNRLTTASNIVGSRINGAAVFTVACWVKYATAATGAATDNRIFNAPINSTSAGVVLNFNAFSSPGNVRAAAFARSQSADSLQTAATSTNMAANTWYHFTAVFDIAADRIRTYVNGALEQTATVTFGANAFTLGTPSENEALGSSAGGTGQLDGSVADLAVWSTDITVANAVRLAAGERPTRVLPASLELYWPLYAAEADVVRQSALTAGGTGTPGTLAHPALKPVFTGAGVC